MKRFVWKNETKKLINKYLLGYIPDNDFYLLLVELL